jgi:hypothetical protein
MKNIMLMPNFMAAIICDVAARISPTTSFGTFILELIRKSINI